MSYLCEEFNIKTFPSETLVFPKGVFSKKLSTYKHYDFDEESKTLTINKKSKLPIHIMYFGEISGNKVLNIDINSINTKVIMTLKTKNKKPAFFNINIKNTGKNSVFDSQIICKNENSLNIAIKAIHCKQNTGIFVKTRVLATKNTITNLQGSAFINKNIEECDSDISFSVMADETAKITMIPNQFIKSVPNMASHSAALYRNKENQINYLKTSGLSDKEVKCLLEEIFLSEQ